MVKLLEGNYLRDCGHGGSIYPKQFNTGTLVLEREYRAKWTFGLSCSYVFMFSLITSSSEFKHIISENFSYSLMWHMPLYMIPIYPRVQTIIPPQTTTYLKSWSTNDGLWKKAVQSYIHGLPHCLLNQSKSILTFILNFALKLFFLGTSVDLSLKIIPH